ncbi:MAG: NAD(P)-dependent oxidoreductase [Acidimicrobiia bacterium]|nr:NAD(P)-dependent oxidoreductase [Acidimicrobiia bacterium]
MEPNDYERFPTFWDDPMIRRWNLWGYVDARDVAQATRLALEADTTGSDNFLVAAGDTCMKTSSAELMAAAYPDVPIRRELAEFETLLSVDKARDVLGYEPAHSWRRYV